MLPEQSMASRRTFLATVAAAGAAGVLFDPSRARAIVRDLRLVPGEPESIARDEDFWLQVKTAFTCDRNIINLNNGGVSPSPAFVHEAMKRHLDFSNSTPPPVSLWRELEPRKESVRAALAEEWGVDPEEIALTRNASEGLQICQLGFDLKPGDEVLTTTQDYPRMITTFKQRERREGIVLKQFPLPIPCENPAEIVSLFEKNITPRTRLILACHIINITGQILPIREIVAMARTKNAGIPVIVDGAHALGQFDFKLSDLGCDYYAVSLHKWLTAPIGTGLLYVRREKIKGLWPLMAADAKQDGDIRKFEEIGTHPAAQTLAIAEALTFHQGIGGARKEARLRHLRDYWAPRLLAGRFGDRVRMHTSLKPPPPLLSCCIANVEFDGIDNMALSAWLWDKHKILTVYIKHEEFQGLRITPNVYTTLPELDRFCDAVEWALEHGLPEPAKP
jgi:selenocysteine lyase/cysteine desulfurase